MLLNIRIFNDNGVLIFLEVRNIFALFSQNPQMDHTCNLKEDKSIEKCNDAECQNVIHLCCFKILVATLGENEWEGKLFCNQCFGNFRC